MKVVFTCGRMNPPNLGHAGLIRALQTEAEKSGSTAVVFATRTQDGERNPLEPEAKKTFVERAFGIPVRLTKSPYSALEELVGEGATEITFVVGEDRYEKFQPMVAYATKIGAKVDLRSNPRDADAPSSTRARQAVLENDMLTFRSLVPSPHEGFADELFHAVRSGLSGDACQPT
jgi:hypothetical protein